MKAESARTGTLLVRTSDQGPLRPLPTLATDIEIKVTATIARSTITQHFGNPTDQWLEGVYVFPLPETASVDNLVMKIGERVIVGEIEEKIQAKKIYEKAKQEGKKATLLEQERANVFSTKLANIGPGEIVSISIDYQQTIAYSQGEFALRVPLVIAPRYIPGTTTITGFSGTGWAENTDEVPDASRITPPVADPNDGPINPVRIRAHIDAGFPINVRSPSHTIKATKDASGTHVELATQSVPADADFILEWRPLVGNAPAAALFSDVFQGNTYALLMVVPPSEQDAVPERLPRETIIVIDTSGSMDGDSIIQAKAALQMALRRLAPSDHFNVIEFDSSASKLFGTSQPATSKKIEQAIRYVKRLRADNGTEMMNALVLALGSTGELNKVRQVIFITDGAVGNEPALFSYIKKHLGRSRLFTVGIGSAPNSFFMRKAAEFGHGTFTHIGYQHQVREKMEELFSKLESPVLSEISIDWRGQQVEHWPQVLPDLYLGEPVVIVAKLPKLGGDVGVVGWRGGKPWSLDFKLEGGSTHSGIDRLWARKKIDALMSSLAGGADAEAVRAKVVALGLTHHLLTRHTSLVAVEQTPSRPQEKSLTSSAMPTNLPRGWVMESVFGQRSQEVRELREAIEDARGHRVIQAKTQTTVDELKKMQDHLRVALQDLDAPAKSTAAAATRLATSQGALPQTATGAPLFILLGLLLLALAWLLKARRWNLA
jgi:Ca-activated chloride channel family protein